MSDKEDPKKTAQKGKEMPKGRLKRFAKLAVMGAEVSARIASKAARKFVGDKKKENESEGKTASQPQGKAQERLETLIDTFGLDVKSAEKIVATLGEMKGVAMKLGQHLSMQEDILAPEVRAIIQKLCKDAEPIDFETIKAVIEAELNASIESLFDEFENQAFAAASIGQVHRARLKTGEAVAVKVQYPGADEALLNDIKNLGVMVKTLSAAVGKSEDAREFYGEIAAETKKELDYGLEAENNRELARLLSLFSDIKIPKVYDEFSYKKVLTMELIEGITLKESFEQERSGEERLRLASQLIRAVYAPFFYAGVVHADPHPGNWMIMPDGRLGVLDFGAVKRVPLSFVKAYWLLAMDYVEDRYAVDVAGLLEEGGFEIRLPREKANKILFEISEVMRLPFKTAYFDFSGSPLNRKLREIALTYNWEIKEIVPPSEVIFFFRAMGGLINNLGMLKARGDFRPIFREVMDGAYLDQSEFAQKYRAIR